jgi:hypothetical protein
MMFGQLLISTVAKKSKACNVEFPLCLIKHHAMKTWGCGSIALPFLTLVLDGGEL